MKIIKAEELFAYMDAHRWTALHKSQIEQFVVELDKSDLDNRKAGYVEAINDVIDLIVKKKESVEN